MNEINELKKQIAKLRERVAVLEAGRNKYAERPRPERGVTTPYPQPSWAPQFIWQPNPLPYSPFVVTCGDNIYA